MAANQSAASPGEQVVKKGVIVLDGFMQAPPTYDPDTYDLDSPTPGTSEGAPEPEEYDPDAYKAWGRKHFGDEWLEKRAAMMEGRNIYLDIDPAYQERQRELRLLEHRIERRPCEPAVLEGGSTSIDYTDEGWRRLWARLSETLPPELLETRISSPASSVASGFITYPPTPEYQPQPTDPWAILEVNKKEMHLTEEEYQFSRVFLKEYLIDQGRAAREDRECSWRRGEERKKIDKLRRPSLLPSDPVRRQEQLAEYERQIWRFGRRLDGLTEDEIDAKAGEEEQKEEMKARYHARAMRAVAKLRNRPDPNGGGQGSAGDTPGPEPLRNAVLRKPRNTARVIKSRPKTAREPQRASRRLAGQPPEFGLLPDTRATRQVGS